MFAIPEQFSNATKASLESQFALYSSLTAKTFEGMKVRKVLVKNVSKLHPLLANCLRLTVGTPQENQLMLAALKESL